MVIGHVLPDRETSLLDAYEKCRSLADPKVCCDYALHMGITWWAPKVSEDPSARSGEGPVARLQGLVPHACAPPSAPISQRLVLSRPCYCLYCTGSSWASRSQGQEP